MIKVCWKNIVRLRGKKREVINKNSNKNNNSKCNNNNNIERRTRDERNRIFTRVFNAMWLFFLSPGRCCSASLVFCCISLCLVVSGWVPSLMDWQLWGLTQTCERGERINFKLNDKTWKAIGFSLRQETFRRIDRTIGKSEWVRQK